MNKDPTSTKPTQVPKQAAPNQIKKAYVQTTNIDFNKLSWGTLRKYQYYFKVKPEEEVRDKESAVRAVSQHFEEMKIDHNKLIYKFLKIKKDEKNDQLYNLRKSQRSRVGGPGITSEAMFAQFP